MRCCINFGTAPLGSNTPLRVRQSDRKGSTVAEFEETLEDTYDFEAGTYTSCYSSRSFIEERKRWDRLIIEGIIVVDTEKHGAFVPSFIPAGESERIWRETRGREMIGNDPRWKVMARRFIWEKRGGPEGKNLTGSDT
jgi:hypothetical protein